MNRSDDFNRTGSVALGGATPSDGGAAWTDEHGNFETGLDGGSGEVVAFTGVAGLDGSAWLESSVTDYEVIAEIVNFSGASQSGVSARLADNDNYYYYYSDASGNMNLYKKVTTTFTLLASGTHTFTPGVGNTISLKCQGSTLTGYVGATQDVQVTDTALATGTKGGLRANANGNLGPFYNSLTITDLSSVGGILYTQLERSTRGLLRGIYGGD